MARAIVNAVAAAAVFHAHWELTESKICLAVTCADQIGASRATARNYIIYRRTLRQSQQTPPTRCRQWRHRANPASGAPLRLHSADSRARRLAEARRA